MLYKTAADGTGGNAMTFERTVREIDGDYAVLVSDDGAQTRVALALLPDGVCEGMRLRFEDFEYHIV